MTDVTRESLLVRVRNPRDADAWAEFHELYAPLLFRYGKAKGLSDTDADEVRSDCYEALVRQMPHFQYHRERGGFKAWLRTMVARRVIDRLRKKRERQADSQQFRELESDDPAPDEVWEREWRSQHLRYCVQSAREKVGNDTWRVFRLLLEDGKTVAEVCDELSISANQVYKARSRMLAHVRDRMKQLMADAEVSEAT